jgi:hypothetical protein
VNRYWTRIAIGAILVFCLGMSATVAVRKGKAEVRSLLATVGRRLPLKLAHLGFRLDGRRLGDLTGLEIQRDGPDDVGRVTVRVRLDTPEDLATLANCSLAAESFRGFDDQSGFRCAAGSELGGGELVKLGEVVFQPGDLSRPLYLERHDAERWRHSEVRSLDASLVTDARGAVRAQGTYDLMSHQGNAERGSFNLKADSQGAVISVRDDQGRALVDFRADQNGLNLNVRDRHGRNLVRMLADSLGAAFRVHQ